MSQALSLHADEIYESLASDRQRALCQGIFQALTVEESNSRGIRRPQRLGRLWRDSRGSGRRAAADHRRLPAKRRHVLDAVARGRADRPDDHRHLSRKPDARLDAAAAVGRGRDAGRRASTADCRKARPCTNKGKRVCIATRSWGSRWRGGNPNGPTPPGPSDTARDLLTAMGFLEASHAGERRRRAVPRSRPAARAGTGTATGRGPATAAGAAAACGAQASHDDRGPRRRGDCRGARPAFAALSPTSGRTTLAAWRRQKEEAARTRRRPTRTRSAPSNATQETAEALAQVASQKAEGGKQPEQGREGRAVARAAEEAGRKLLYTTDMRLAPFVWRDDRTTANNSASCWRNTSRSQVSRTVRQARSARLRVVLLPALAGTSAAVFSGHGVAVVDGAFSADGQLVTLDQDGQVRRWDLGSQAEDKASRRDLPGGPALSSASCHPNGRLAALAEGEQGSRF